MSGGHFDYQEHNISYIIDDIKELIEKNGEEKSSEDLYPWDYDKSTGEIIEDCKYYYKYSDETINEFKKAVDILELAYIYAHRIDYLVSGDDDEDDFHRRIKEDIEECFGEREIN